MLAQLRQVFLGLRDDLGGTVLFAAYPHAGLPRAEATTA